MAFPILLVGGLALLALVATAGKKKPAATPSKGGGAVPPPGDILPPAPPKGEPGFPGGVKDFPGCFDPGMPATMMAKVSQVINGALVLGPDKLLEVAAGLAQAGFPVAAACVGEAATKVQGIPVPPVPGGVFTGVLPPFLKELNELAGGGLQTPPAEPPPPPPPSPPGPIGPVV